MKNAIALFLLFLFAFNLGGAYLIMKFQQFQIRKEIAHKIKHGICESGLTLITITPENEAMLIWENGDEFSYKGIMYDVVFVETIDPTNKIYHCISDMQETSLISKYGKERKKNGKNQTDRTNALWGLKFLPLTYPVSYKNDFAISGNENNANFNYFNSYVARCVEISSPPPKQVL